MAEAPEDHDPMIFEPLDPREQGNSQSRVISTALGMATLGVLPVFLVGSLAPQLANEFGYGPKGIGLTVGCFYIASSTSSIALGRFADRIGWRRSIRIGAWGCVVSLLGLGAVSSSLLTVALLLAVAGLSNALIQPAVNLLLARSVTPRRKGLFFGLKQAAIPVATLTGGLSIPIIALTVGWRWTFVGAAGLGLVVLAGVPPSRSGPVSIDVATSSISGLRELVPLIIVSLLGHSGASALGSFMVASAVSIGISETNSGLLLALSSVIGIITRVAFGWLADRGLRSDLLPVATLLIVGAGGMVVSSIPTVGTAILGSIIAFGAGWGWPGLFNLIVVNRFADAPATATAATQIGTYVGNGAGPVLFGLIAANSFSRAWLVSGLLLSAAAVVAFASFASARVAP